MASYIYSYKKIATRLGGLPLILAGPILRRVTPESVTVWVALRKPSKVTLSLFASGSDTPLVSSDPRNTHAIGENLHVLAVTVSIAPPLARLQPGRLYTYSLTFNGKGLNEAGVYGTNASDLNYPGFSRPSFVLAPESWKDLHILHGSCRKFHALGDDALVWGDDALKPVAGDASKRHQMMFLTGDQIYADDVAAPALHIAQDVGETLLGPKYEETFFGYKIKDNFELLRPGRRSAVAEFTCHLTAGASVDSSHLFYFSEFCATYLMAWSDVVWPGHPTDFPNYKDVYNKDSENGHALQYLNHAALTAKFVLDLKRVRRLLANIATYMILDDHEITDDAFISANWCARVLGSDEGRQVVRNALKAYAIFQAWGNTPEQFDVSGSPGDKLLGQLFKGPGAKDDDVDYLLNIPHKNEIFSPNIYPNATPPPETPTALLSSPTPDLSSKVREARAAGRQLTLKHAPPSAGGAVPFLVWYFTLNFKTYQFIVLDPRMWRWYPGSPKASGMHGDYPCIVLSPEGMTKQVLEAGRPPAGTVPEVTFLVTAGPPLSVPPFEHLQGFGSADRGNFLVNFFDTESWSAHEHGLQWFFSTLATRDTGQPDAAGQPRQRRIVVLSGDVHHTFAVRIQYWARAPYNVSFARDTEAVFALLTSSAFKNEDWKTSGATSILKSRLNVTRDLNVRGVHGVGNGPFRSSYRILGWANVAEQAIVVGSRQVSTGRRSEDGGTVAVSWVTAKQRPALLDLRQGSAHVLKRASEWRYSLDYIRSRDAEHRAVVGHNNLCELHFVASGGSAEVVQRVWWLGQPRTSYHVNFNLGPQPDYPDPETGILNVTP